MSGFDGQGITSEAELREIVPPPKPSSPPVRKQLDHLDDHCRAVLAHSPFFVLATSAPDGSCDASPRGGPPGFVEVLDEHRLRVPEYPGNRRLDSHSNILATGRAGLLFFLPGRGETLRIDARATLLREPAPLALGIEVEEVFLHCAKALLRSGLWKPEEWPDLSDLPSAGAMLRDHVRIEGLTVEASEERLAVSYRDTLY